MRRFHAEDPRSAPASARGPRPEEIEASELAETLDETLDASELESSTTGDKKRKRKPKSGTKPKKSTVGKKDGAKDKEAKSSTKGKDSIAPSSKDKDKDKSRKSRQKD